MKTIIYALFVLVVLSEIAGHRSYAGLTILCFFVIKEYELKSITDRLTMLERKNKELP